MNSLNNRDRYVYILVRTTINQKHDHLKTMLESIAKQDYPKIKLLLLVDTHNKSVESTPKCVELLQNYDIDVIVRSFDCGNSSKSLLTIRDIFCSIAKPNDIAIQLDDDDELAEKAVSLIVSKMASSKSDICMINYVECHDNVNTIIKDHSGYSRLLQEIEKLNEGCSFKSIPHLYLAATMGWTKCYNQKTLNRFNEMIKECDIKRMKERRPKYGDMDTCEDFVDFSTLLLTGISFTAISTPLYIYKKHKNSVTFLLKPESFSIDRIGFLRYLQEIIYNNIGRNFNNSAIFMARQFVKYKISIITKILNGRYPEYTSDNLFADLNDANPYVGKISKEEAFVLYDAVNLLDFTLK